jgi:hypothetical protein
MKWLLILVAVHVNNPADIPARLSIEFNTQAECKSAQSSLKTWIKFDTFKVVSECSQQS